MSSGYFWKPSPFSRKRTFWKHARSCSRCIALQFIIHKAYTLLKNVLESPKFTTNWFRIPLFVLNRHQSSGSASIFNVSFVLLCSTYYWYIVLVITRSLTGFIVSSSTTQQHFFGFQSLTEKLTFDRYLSKLSLVLFIVHWLVTRTSPHTTVHSILAFDQVHRSEVLYLVFFSLLVNIVFTDNIVNNQLLLSGSYW